MYNFFKRITDETVARSKGRRDGEIKIPPVDWAGGIGQISEFEKKLCTKANSQIAKLYSMWKNKESDILKKMDSSLNTLQTYLITFQKLKNSRANVIIEPEVKLSWFEWMLWIFFVLCEIGFNIYSFKFLREPLLTTILLGLMLTVFLPAAGFNIGKLWHRKDKGVILRIFSLFLFIVLLVSIIIFAFARKSYLQRKGLEESDLYLAFGIFLLMNLGFLIFSVLEGIKLSFENHTFNYLFYKHIKKRIRHFDNKIDELIKNFNNVIKNVIEIQNYYNRLSNIYREYNIIARGGRNSSEIPKYFTTGEKLPIDLGVLSNYFNLNNITDPVENYKKQLFELEVIKKGKSLKESIVNIINK
ncbi:MAG: hypothetical protein N3A01_09880 [Bacteroidales bacterium]|nr:hypothetical protein [Bacteroidales bacterium]